MPGWQFWVFVLILLIVHFFLHLALGLAGSAPDLATVAALLSARRVNRPVAALVGGVIGLVRDALALIAFGADAAALAIVGYIGARTRDLFVGDSALFVFMYLFLGKWLHDALYHVLRSWGGGISADGGLAQLLLSAPVAALYAAIAGGIALSMYRWLSGER
ncbi:MAG: hypothetical protein ACRELV_03110 [Longimicrobiales bacterium]